MTEPVAVPHDDAPHLLVVDDDTRIRNLLKQFLTEHGFRITVAGNADEARRKLAGLDFDLIVLDVMMPGESGIELTKSLRSEKDVPILMLTALSETDRPRTGDPGDLCRTRRRDNPASRTGCGGVGCWRTHDRRTDKPAAP